MSYQSRIREIQSSFVMGYADRETCISLFEQLLHEYGLLPVGEQLDRTITNENFLNLLRAAKDHRIDAAPRGDIRQYSIAEAVRQRCPVCQQPASGVFDRVQTADQMIPVDPPRCKECMRKWIAEKFGTAVPKAAEPPTTVSVDRTPASPMSASEADFFAEYERQMESR